MTDLIQELTAEDAYLLIATKVKELTELLLSGSLSPQDVTQAMKDCEVMVEDGTAVNNITPRQQELLEELGTESASGCGNG